MNYRHSFHAGNFADLVKHALMLWLLERRQTSGPVAVIDTHAGAGVYDFSGDGARSREAEAGVARLMAADGLPPAVQVLADAVAAMNPRGGVSIYPGSPLLVANRLRREDRYIGYELHPPVLDLLRGALEPFPFAEARGGDGYDQSPAEAARSPAPLVLIDPPFERPDDYLRAADTAAVVARRDAKAVVAVWTPLKDMETFDGFLRRLDQKGVRGALVAEARLRPLINPMTMNGCAMVVLNPPPGTQDAAAAICGWVADNLGDPGARAEVWVN